MTRGLDEFSTPTPTSIRVVRRFDAPVELVWRAHSEPDLVKQWMTGLAVCEIDFRVGGAARHVWKNPEFEMVVTSEFTEIVEHQRVVYTEQYEGWPEGATTVTATFTDDGPQSIITVDIEYLSQEARDMAMQPGFEEGFAGSYLELDKLLPELAT